MNWFTSIYRNWKEYKRLKKASKESTLENHKLLIEEYNLIQLKQSKLSRSQREDVERIVHELIKTGEIEVQFKRESHLKKV
jgi:hypothetical protein